jgi:hypothetical protein
MTDKQIIIDGVDVSGCPFFEDERKLLNPAGQELNFKNICSLSFYNFTDFDKDFLCNQSPNCYYKQLKRKEQECERLKKEVEFYTAPVKLGDYKPITLIIEELDQLKQAIEKIKELIQKEINDCEHCEDCASCEYNCCTKQILQKISEVENGI